MGDVSSGGRSKASFFFPDRRHLQAAWGESVLSWPASWTVISVLCVSQVAQRQFALSHGGSSWAAGWEASAASTGAAVQTPI